MTDSGGSDPFADAPVKPLAKASQPAPLDEWETIIVRGAQSQTRTFPMPDHPDSGSAGHMPATTRPTADALHPGTVGAL
jgi:hypothetical protein